MQETMMTYIRQEPMVLQEVLARRKERLAHFLAQVENRELDHWVVLATGSSANAMLCAKYYVEKFAKVRITFKTNQPFICYDQPVSDHALVFAVSQSGRSTSTIKALETASNALCFALTGNLSSEIGRHTANLIDIGCGEEKVGYVTKGFSATMLTFMLIGLESARAWNRISAEEYEEQIEALRGVIGQIEGAIARTTAWYEEKKEILCAAPHMIAIGYGPSMGVINEFDTKFTETVRIPVHARELEEYMHGPYLQAKEEQCVLFFDTPNPLRERLLRLKEYLGRYCGHCLTISTRANGEDSDALYLGVEGDELLLPLLTAVPVQVLAYLIAEETKSDYQSGKFRDFGTQMNSKYRMDIGGAHEN